MKKAYIKLIIVFLTAALGYTGTSVSENPRTSIPPTSTLGGGG